MGVLTAGMMLHEAPPIPMTEGVWVAIFTTLGVIVAAICGIIPALVTSHRQQKRILDQVENSHRDPVTGQPTIIRDDIDRTEAKIDRITEMMDHQARVSTEIKGSVKRLDAEVGRINDRLLFADETVGKTRDKLDEHVDDALDWRRQHEEVTRKTLEAVEDLETTLNVKKEKP